MDVATVLASTPNVLLGVVLVAVAAAATLALAARSDR